MRTAHVARRVTTVLTAGPLLAVLFGAALLTAPPAHAGDSHGWRVGDCFTDADVYDDFVLLDSKVECSRPHAVQVMGGATLPASFAQYSLDELRDDANASLQKDLVRFANGVCSGASTAPNIWPGPGTDVAEALTGSAARITGGVVPGIPGMGMGWVFPDDASFNGGDRSLLCVVYVATGAAGTPDEGEMRLVGDARLMATTRTFPRMRTCFDLDAAGEDYVKVSCARPHREELLAYFARRLPADVPEMTDAQWAPFDRQCEAILDALVGEDRSDLSGYANAGADLKSGSLAYISCTARRTADSAGERGQLPGGTVVGLGRNPLSRT